MPCLLLMLYCHASAIMRYELMAITICRFYLLMATGCCRLIFFRRCYRASHIIGRRCHDNAAAMMPPYLPLAQMLMRYV